MSVFFAPFISKKGLENLKHYQYKSGGYGIADTVLNPWWEYIAHRLPLSLAPNVITVVGFLLCVAAFFLGLMPWSRYSSSSGATWVNYLIAALTFTYQTLDAVDGKQARRLNASTPLGQLFDHGCDAFTTFLLLYTFESVTFLAPGLMIWLSLVLQTYLFFFTWWEKHFHEFRCSIVGLGVTEVQLLIIFTHVLAGYYGSDCFFFKLEQLFPSVLSTFPGLSIFADFYIVDFIGYVICLCCTLVIIWNLFMGCLNSSHRIRAVAEVLYWSFHLASHYALMSSAAQYSELPMRILIMFSTCIIILRMNIAVVCKMEISAVHLPALPSDIIALYLWYNYPLRNISPGMQLVTVTSNIQMCLYATLLWNCVYLFHFVYSCINDACRVLQIRVFSVKRLHAD